MECEVEKQETITAPEMFSNRPYEILMIVSISPTVEIHRCPFTLEASPPSVSLSHLLLFMTVHFTYVINTRQIFF